MDPNAYSFVQKFMADKSSLVKSKKSNEKLISDRFDVKTSCHEMIERF
jgi:hypothetical protein